MSDLKSSHAPPSLDYARSASRLPPPTHPVSPSRHADPLSIVPFGMCVAGWALLFFDRAAALVPDVASQGASFKWGALVVASVVLQPAAGVCAIVAVLNSRSPGVATAGLLASVLSTIAIVAYLMSFLPHG